MSVKVSLNLSYSLTCVLLHHWIYPACWHECCGITEFILFVDMSAMVLLNLLWAINSFGRFSTLRNRECTEFIQLVDMSAVVSLNLSTVTWVLRYHWIYSACLHECCGITQFISTRWHECCGILEFIQLVDMSAVVSLNLSNCLGNPIKIYLNQQHLFVPSILSLFPRS